MIPVVLGLGSNKKLPSSVEEGSFLHPVEILKNAFELLKYVLKDCTLSSIYKAKAMYVENQEDFYKGRYWRYL